MKWLLSVNGGLRCNLWKLSQMEEKQSATFEGCRLIMLTYRAKRSIVHLELLIVHVVEVRDSLIHFSYLQRKKGQMAQDDDERTRRAMTCVFLMAPWSPLSPNRFYPIG